MEKRTCKYCKAEQDIDVFKVSVIKNGVSYRRWKCSDCYQARKKERRHEIGEWFEFYKRSLKCSVPKCRNADFRVLEFHHHLDDKEFNVSDVVTQAYGRERIMGEVAKCKVLCANCHRILHYEERKIGK